MASIIDTAKKLANKISDEVNKGKWDSSSVNTALFSSGDPYKAVTEGGPGLDPISDDQAQKQAGASTMVAPAPEPLVSGERPRVRESVAEEQQQESALQADSVPSQSPAGGGYVKPVFRSRFGGPGGYTTSKVSGNGGLRSLSELPVVDRSQAISSIGPVTANNILQSQQAVQQQETTTAIQEQAEPAAPAAAAASQKCYYVLITHTKSYPAPRSQVLMRSCDHGYAWTNNMTEDQKPKSDICPFCGKEIGYTETEID